MSLRLDDSVLVGRNVLNSEIMYLQHINFLTVTNPKSGVAIVENNVRRARARATGSLLTHGLNIIVNFHVPASTSLWASGRVKPSRKLSKDRLKLPRLV